MYDTDPHAFSNTMVQLARLGAGILGGCCGTTPEYIRKTKEKTADLPFTAASEKAYTLVSSYTHAVVFDGDPVLIGERINPTGKPKIKEALRQGDFSIILKEGLRQGQALSLIHIFQQEIISPCLVTSLTSSQSSRLLGIGAILTRA